MKDKLANGHGALLSDCSADYGLNKYDYVADSTASQSFTLSGCSPDAPSKNPQIWIVAACTLTACLTSLGLGMVLGFSSPALPQLQFDVPPELQITDDDIKFSLFGALAPVGAMFGSLVSGPISDLIGRKISLILSGVPAIVGWLMIALAHFVTQSNATAFYSVLLIGRALTGLSGGWSIVSVSTYISEIASAKLKGLFGSCNEFFITIGIFISYFLGIDYKQSDGSYTNLKYWHTALISAGIVVIFEVLMMFTYESPRWLFSKHKNKKAIRVLKALRGPNFRIKEEVERIRASFQGQAHSVFERLKEFRHRSVIVPFLLTIMLMFYEGFSGLNAAIFYASHIFQEAGLNKHEVNLIVAISIGLVQIIATLLAVFIVDYVGRKVLLTLSSIGLALSCLVLGIYFYIYDNVCDGYLVGDPAMYNVSSINDTVHKHFPCNTTQFGYLAVVCTVIMVISYSLGWGPVSLTSICELMPNRVRSLAGSFAIFSHWVIDFIIALCFKYYSRPPIGNDGAWWTFSLIMFSAIAMVILFLPETKGHSLEEIQEHFEKGHIFAVSCHSSCKAQSIRSKDLYSSIDRNK